MKRLFFSTNSQKVLDFLIDAQNGEFERIDIEKKIGISKAGVNLALKELVKYGLIDKTTKGRSNLYKADFVHPVVKQVKFLKTVIKINSLVNKIKFLSKKIIIFGSSGRGENTPKSDIDLFVLTRDKEAVKAKIKRDKFGKKIQLVLKNPTELAELEKRDKYFFKEIDRGVCLWESYE